MRELENVVTREETMVIKASEIMTRKGGQAIWDL